MKTNKILFALPLLVYQLCANDGQTVGNNLRGHFSNFQSTISNPLTSDTEFTTVDGSSSFKSNLTCGEQTKSFLEITYTGTSDITIYVNVDTNLDGVKNKSFSFTGVSGVGTNGLIKCDTNTWNNCNYYLWTLSSNNLDLQLANRFDIGGGYCINNSCGSISTSQKQSILDTIGGSVASMYQNSNSKYLITKTSNNGNKIEFYGQNYEDCQNFQDSQPTGSMDTTDIVAEQSNDENSVYYSLNKSIENQNTNDFDSEVDTTLEANKGVTVDGDTSDYSFSYTGKQKDENGNWVVSNNNAKINIDWINPDIKYCEIKFIEENTIVFSDGETHHSSAGDTQTWKTKIVECTGDDYSVCPYDSSIGEIIKHPCGDIDNFAEVTSILMAVKEATDDFSCSSN